MSQQKESRSESASLSMTNETCPFCSGTVESPSIHGVNCDICHDCGDAVQHYTPVMYHVHGSIGTFSIWSYIPVAGSWDGDEYAVFLDQDGDMVSESTLNDQERKIINAVITDTEINDVSGMVEAPDVTPADVNNHSEHVPCPTVTSGETVYTVNRTELKNVVTDTAGETAQASLSSLVGGTDDASQPNEQA